MAKLKLTLQGKVLPIRSIGGDTKTYVGEIMQKTEKVKLDIDLISEELYQAIVKEFHKSRNEVVCVNDIEISAILEFEE